MRVLVTGAEGFIGRNLVESLRHRADLDVVALDRGDGDNRLLDTVTTAEVVVHLAGVNRPEVESEFQVANVDLTERIVAALEGARRTPKVVFTSSTQAALENAYGRSKKHAEDLLNGWSERTGAPVALFRLPGVFGKWCRPDYNSVVATFCHNVARDLPVTVSDPDRELSLVYVGDVVEAFIGELEGSSPGVRHATVEPVYVASLGALLGTIRSFREHRRNLQLPDFADALTRKLYATYASYLPRDSFAYALERREDPRGVLAEFLKSVHFGQIFVSRTRPGVTRGHHYHDTKVEKFLVLEGEAAIVFRHRVTGETVGYPVKGTELRVVDIPPGWAHAITNVGAGEMVVLFWASEPFDPARPDTFSGDAGT